MRPSDGSRDWPSTSSTLKPSGKRGVTTSARKAALAAALIVATEIEVDLDSRLERRRADERCAGLGAGAKCGERQEQRRSLHALSSGTAPPCPWSRRGGR